MRPLSRRLAEEHRAQPQAAANRLLNQVHAFDGHLALLVRRSISETSTQLLHARILAAVDAPQATFELGCIYHSGWQPASILHRRCARHRIPGRVVVICSLAVLRGDMLTFRPISLSSGTTKRHGCDPKSSKSTVNSQKLPW